MGSQGPGRKRIPNRVTAEEDALNIIAREAEAQLAAKRMARTEAREIRMRQLEMQQKEIYQIQKEDSEQYTHHSLQQASMMNEDDEEQLDGRNSVQGSSRVQTPSVATLSCLERPSTHIESEDSSVTVNEIKEYHELKDQIQDVESKYIQSLKEMKNSLTEMEEKYRKAMVSIAQLDNEKSALMYQVDTLKDSLLDLEEAFAESLKEIEEKSRDLEREKHVHSVMQFQINELKEAQKQTEERLTEIHQLRLKNDKFVTEVADLQETVEWKNKKIAALERQKEFSDAIRNERDELRDEVVQLRHILKKHGIVLGPDLSNNVEVEEQVTDVSASTKGQEGSSVLVINPVKSKFSRKRQRAESKQKSQNAAQKETRLGKLVDERECLIEQINMLKGQLEQTKNLPVTEDKASSEEKIMGIESDLIDKQENSKRQISELKFKLDKSEHKVTALEQNITRLEGQMILYKTAADNAEQVEDQLKAEKRKLQRELRSALEKIEDLETSKKHLTKRLEKMKANKS